MRAAVMSAIRQTSYWNTITNTCGFNLTGHPAISIPCGWDEEGLPVGLQAVAPWHDDQRLIDLAAAIEFLQPWTDRWPDLATQDM